MTRKAVFHTFLHDALELEVHGVHDGDAGSVRVLVVLLLDGVVNGTQVKVAAAVGNGGGAFVRFLG